MPCESTPRRLEATRQAAVSSALCGDTPAPSRIRSHKRVSSLAVTVGMLVPCFPKAPDVYSLLPRGYKHVRTAHTMSAHTMSCVAACGHLIVRTNVLRFDCRKRYGCFRRGGSAGYCCGNQPGDLRP